MANNIPKNRAIQAQMAAMFQAEVDTPGPKSGPPIDPLADSQYDFYSLRNIASRYHAARWDPNPRHSKIEPLEIRALNWKSATPEEFLTVAPRSFEIPKRTDHRKVDLQYNIHNRRPAVGYITVDGHRALIRFEAEFPRNLSKPSNIPTK